MGVLCCVLVLLSSTYVLSSFTIILLRKRDLVAFLKLKSCCCVAFGVLCLFLMVLWVGLQCTIVAFPDHTHLLFPVWNNC